MVSMSYNKSVGNLKGFQQIYLSYVRSKIEHSYNNLPTQSKTVLVGYLSYVRSKIEHSYIR